jgi:hypothetical protein
LATIRDLARFLTNGRGKHDWALVDVHDLETFRPPCPERAGCAVASGVSELLANAFVYLDSEE